MRTKNWSITQGAKLAELRIKKGFTQKYVAGKVGVHPTTMVHWENGKNCPNSKYLHDLAFLYNVTVEELMGMEPIKKDEVVTSPEKNTWTASYLAFQPEKPETKFSELVDLMADLTGRTSAEIIDSAIQCYAMQFPWQTCIQQRYFDGDNKTP